MYICGVEIKGREAVISILSMDKGLVEIVETSQRSLILDKSGDSDSMHDFQKCFCALMHEHGACHIAIKERLQKGKFSGGALGFKMEAAIQLIPELNVELMSSSALKAQLKSTPVSIGFEDTGLKKFQEQAFMTAYARLMRSV